MNLLILLVLCCVLLRSTAQSPGIVGNVSRLSSVAYIVESVDRNPSFFISDVFLLLIFVLIPGIHIHFICYTRAEIVVLQF